jgi:hypothetical protein
MGSAWTDKTQSKPAGITRRTRFAARRFWTRAIPRIGPIGLGFSFTSHPVCRSLAWRQSFSILIFALGLLWQC